MNLNKIQYFFKAAECQNFSRAAELCHIAQTTMSKYIAEVESELGFPLFTRTAKMVSLTEDGWKFYEGMQKIFAEYEVLLNSIGSSEQQNIKIGMITRDFAEFPVLRSFEKSHETYNLNFIYGKEESLISDFQNGKLDALICPDFFEFHGIRKDEVERCNLSVSSEILVYVKDLEKTYGSIKEVVKSVPLITKTDSAEFHETCREKLRRFAGETFETIEVVREFHQQVLMVNLGKGFAIVPDSQAYTCECLCVHSLPECFDEVTQLVYRKKSNNRALRAMTDYIRQCMK